MNIPINSYFHTSLGTICVTIHNDFVTNISFANNSHSIDLTPLAKEVFLQLTAYLNGQLKVFDFPYKLQGTPFQQKVWATLKQIPYGETATYKDIALNINCPKGARAVGLANNKNPLMIVVPCHRVIGSNGKLTGYAGGIEIKEKLLQLEQVYI